MNIINHKGCVRCEDGDIQMDLPEPRCGQCGWAGDTDDNPPPVLPEGEVGLVSYYAAIRACWSGSSISLASTLS